MDIVVIGLGGVGGYFGGKLCRRSAEIGAAVHFVARGWNLEAIRERGLTVRTAAEGEWTCRPASVTDRIDALPTPDIVLVCVKSYDLRAAAERLGHIVGERTAVIPLLNGVDIHERILPLIPRAEIFPACVFVGTHLAAPGVVEQKGGACKILLGPDPRKSGVVPHDVLRAFAGTGVKHEWFDDAAPSIWTKFVFIAAFGMVTACFDKTLGDVIASQELKGRVRGVMEEIRALALEKGVALPETVVDDCLARGGEFAPNTKTSFQRDVERADKPDERDIFCGTIMRMGRELGIPTPVTGELSGILSRRKP